MQSRFQMWLNRFISGPWLKRIANGAVIVFGILLMIFPDKASDLILNFAAALLGVGGLVLLARHFLGERRPDSLNLQLYFGVFLLILAGAVMMLKGFLLAFIPLAFGTILIIFGLVHGQGALAMKEYGSRRWIIDLACAVISAVLGLVILLYPFDTGLLLIRIIGGAMVFMAVQSLFSVRRRSAKEDDGVIHTDFID